MTRLCWQPRVRPGTQAGKCGKITIESMVGVTGLNPRLLRPEREEFGYKTYQIFINGANIIHHDSDSRYPNRPRNLPSARGRNENESGPDAGYSSRRAIPSRRGRSAYATRTRTLSTHLYSRVQQSGPRSG